MYRETSREREREREREELRVTLFVCAEEMCERIKFKKNGLR